MSPGVYISMEEHEKEMVPLEDAENQVRVVVQRLALLHLSYASTIINKFGWKDGKLLVLSAIKEYGRRVAERTKQGHQSLPKYGFYTTREGQPPICEFGKVVLDYGELDIGSLYCLIDAAKTMQSNPDEKLVHKKCMTVGDEYCEFDTVPTSEQDKELLFSEGLDWSSVDPLLHEFYKKKERDLKG